MKRRIRTVPVYNEMDSHSSTLLKTQTVGHIVYVYYSKNEALSRNYVIFLKPYPKL